MSQLESVRENEGEENTLDDQEAKRVEKTLAKLKIPPKKIDS